MMKAIRVLNPIFASLGIAGSLLSYTRYRALAGSVPAANYWFATSLILVIPFIILGSHGLIVTGGRRSVLAIFVALVAFSTLSLFDAAVPVDRFRPDPEITAAIRLFGITLVLYYPIALAAGVIQLSQKGCREQKPEQADGGVSDK